MAPKVCASFGLPNRLSGNFPEFKFQANMYVRTVCQSGGFFLQRYSFDFVFDNILLYIYNIHIHVYTNGYGTISYNKPQLCSCYIVCHAVQHIAKSMLKNNISKQFCRSQTCQIIFCRFFNFLCFPILEMLIKRTSRKAAGSWVSSEVYFTVRDYLSVLSQGRHERVSSVR